MNRSPLNGRRAPLERRTGLDTTGGGTLRRRASLPRTGGLTSGGLSAGRPATVGASARRRRSPDLDVPPDTRAAVRVRSGGRCEAPLAADCTGTATDVHHRKRRRDGGHAITNLLDLCRPCHSAAHRSPAVARPAGIIVSVYEDPAEVPVVVASRLAGRLVRVLLTADGGYAA